MKNESKKITLIVNEILSFLLYHGGKEIDIQIKKQIDCTNIIFDLNNCEFEDNFVDKLRHDLKNHRQNELEGYYWQLVGKDDLAEELYLVGAMIDESTVTLNKNKLTIEIKRTC